jgi:enoyl-CoA hydratase/carnithine racemase
MSPSQQAFSPTVELKILDQGQIALVTLVDKARSNAMSPKMGDAFQAGFVAKSVAPGRLMEEALALARESATNEPLTTRALTEALRITREQLQPALEADGRRQAESYGTEASARNAPPR